MRLITRITLRTEEVDTGMARLVTRILNEPTLLTDAVRAVVVLLVVMEWYPLKDGQQVQIIITVSAILAVLNRALVTPNTKLSSATVEAAKDVPPNPPV